MPGNPRLCETVKDFIRRQQEFGRLTQWPPGTEFECKGCGDCCEWHFILLNANKEFVKVTRARVKDPHGFWRLVEKRRIKIQMPDFLFVAIGPPNLIEFLTITGRTWGYWVLNQNEEIVLYNPIPCIHLTEDRRCAIYEERPKVCKPYFCRRHPIIPVEKAERKGL